MGRTTVEFHAAARARLFKDDVQTFDPQAARALAERAHRIVLKTGDPGRWRILRTLARAQFESNQRDEAIATLRQAIELAAIPCRPKLNEILASWTAE